MTASQSLQAMQRSPLTVTAQCVLPEAGSVGPLLLSKGVADGGGLAEQVAQGHAQAWGGSTVGAPPPSHIFIPPSPPPPVPRPTSDEPGPQQGLCCPVGSPLHVHRGLPARFTCSGRQAEPWQGPRHSASLKDSSSGDEAALS